MLRVNNDQLRPTILKGIEPLLLARQARVLTVTPKDQKERAYSRYYRESRTSWNNNNMPLVIVSTCVLSL